MIRSANGMCNLKVLKEGDVEIKLFDLHGKAHQITLKHVIWFKEIMINLVSATKLCDLGYQLITNQSHLSFNHPKGQKLHAFHTPNSMSLWTIRVRIDIKQSSESVNSELCFNAKADLIHQRLAHLHSSALKRFCHVSNHEGVKCTACVMSKSARKPFNSSFPISSKPLYRVHLLLKLSQILSLNFFLMLQSKITSIQEENTDIEASQNDNKTTLHFFHLLFRHITNLSWLKDFVFNLHKLGYVLEQTS